MSNDAMRTRAFSLKAGPQSLDESTRTVGAVLATEAPVPMPDYSRGEIVPEVLRLHGVVMPSRVPLLNSHNRHDVGDVLGSVSGLRVDGDRLLGSVQFSEAAGDAWTKTREGHLTDLSVGYAVNRVEYVPRGQSKEIMGRNYDGPVNVVTSWTVREVSVTPIGADSNAKFRQQQKGHAHMNDNINTEFTGQTQVHDRAKLNDYIRSEAKRHGLEAKVNSLIEERHSDVKEIDKRFLDLLAERTANPPGRSIVDERSYISHGRDQADKHRDAIASALQVRTLSKVVEPAKLDKLVERSAGWEDFKYASLVDIARQCLLADGARAHGVGGVYSMAPADVAQAALGLGNRFQVRAGGFHYTASFPKLLQDAANKSLEAAFVEANPSYTSIVRIGDSVPDFKNIHRVRLGDVGNLRLWTDGTTPQQVSLTDTDEKYAVEAFSEIVSFTWRTIVNDDLGAFSLIPGKMGAAAARTVNAAVFSIITSNPTLQDGISLFSDASGTRKDDNTGTAGVISVTTLGEARALMRKMRGLNSRLGNASEAYLNIVPRYFVVPAALETLARQTVNSQFDPTLFSNSTSMRSNPFFGELEVIVEPLLDASSATAYYLFASPVQSPVLELTFLQGQETPVSTSWIDDADWSHNFRITQTFAAKAIDFRGAVKNAGA